MFLVTLLVEVLPAPDPVTLVLLAVVLYLIYHAHTHVPRIVRDCEEEVRLGAIESLAVAVNAKDRITAEHVRRVQMYAVGVGRLMNCTAAELKALHHGALLHDVGKIAVPDRILLKPGKLTPEEFRQMKRHTVDGDQIISRLKFDYPLRAVVRSHHERWDGKGYPDGLKGKQIPLVARVLAVVDCFDAVREDRPYRAGYSREQAREYILEGSGTHFDPEIVGKFLTNLPAFESEIQAGRAAMMSDYGVQDSEQLKAAAMGVRPDAGYLTASA